VDVGAFPPAVVTGGVLHPMPDDPLVRALQSVLYHRCYCHSHDSPPPMARAVTPDAEFTKTLSLANSGADRWDAGWTTDFASPDGALYVRKGDRQLRVMPGEYVAEAVTFRPVVAGSAVVVRAPRESHAVQPGFYFALGETLGDFWDEQQTIRFYFNAGSPNAAELIRALTKSLNRFQVPFRMKALNDPAAYTRADAIVLYVTRRLYSCVCRLIGALPSSITSKFRPRVPLFTRKLRNGVGVAEDPGNGESFGMQRCRLVAEGIVEAGRSGRHDLAAKVRAVRGRFEASGIDLERPHLRGGLVDFPEPAFHS
jgi:hypothetical protein